MVVRCTAPKGVLLQDLFGLAADDFSLQAVCFGHRLDLRGQDLALISLSVMKSPCCTLHELHRSACSR